MKTKSFTLIEILIVIIIIGILATLGIAYFVPMQESALDREAQANLRLIVAAQRTRRMEVTLYYQSSGAATANCNLGNDRNHICNINEELRLLLPTGTNRNWNYRTWANNGVVPPTNCAQATRAVAGGRTWRMLNTENEPVRGGTCP